ncbi:MAG: hypothetical protein JXM73_14320 [Anaerolineae bacterium]|nr:hypothetical protein [Anaerolineae bacterium]
MAVASHCIKERRQQFGNRAMWGILCVLVAFGLLGWIYLSQASYVTVTGRRVQDLETEQARLQKQNQQLIREIAEMQSVERLAVRAEALGFVPIVVDDVKFLVMAEPAETDILLAGTPPTSSWWQRMTDQFLAWSQAVPQ